ncbi:MAG: hypothetical protein M0R48_00545 [Candidatus Omnitrophica bacterium]|nr:hypothetical protein [Candidatus Omnitrophota bacterium]
MEKQIFKNKFWLIIILCFMFMLPSANVFSQHRGRGGQGRGGWHGGQQGNWRNWGYHHPRGYHWYGGSWWFGDALIQSLVIGATLSTLPPSYRIVYVGRTPYYYDGAYYYKPYRSGYVVVADPTVAPVVVASPVVVQAAPPTTNIEPQVQSSGVITINVPNSKGGYTPVQLTKYSNGYLGPQGEFYSGSPTVEQLKALYGQ